MIMWKYLYGEYKRMFILFIKTEEPCLLEFIAMITVSSNFCHYLSGPLMLLLDSELEEKQEPLPTQTKAKGRYYISQSK